MKGETLVEVLVALGIIAVVASALVGVVVTSMGNTRFSRDQNQATQYAQEGVEIVRQKRDDDYAAFRAIATGTYCLDDSGANNLIQPCNDVANVGSLPKSYLRKVTIGQSVATRCALDVARVTVTVSWQDSKCPAGNTFCHSSKLESCLSSVNPVPTL